MRDLVGECLSGRYRVISRLAGGGMGEVYRGHDLLLDRPIAVKVLQPSLAADPEHLERFKSEARAAARLSHPNVVAVYDWGSEDEDTYYMVMEYVSGSDLRDLLAEHKEIEHQVALEIMSEVCDALAAAHGIGLVHRDIKPENILLARDGKVKVADFGIAVVAGAGRSGQGAILGTLRYLAPEQAQGREAGPRSDIWAAGAVLGELLTGRPPATASGAEALQERALFQPVPPSELDPSVSEHVDAIVLRACALRPQDRYPDAAAMGAALRAAVADSWGRKAPAVGEMFGDLTGEVRPADLEPTSFDPESKGARAGRKARVRARRRAAVLGVIMALLLGFVGARAIAAFRAPDWVEVPGLGGLSRERATALLERADLELRVVGRRASRTVAEGGIVSQEPDGGRLLEGSAVSVVLSKGPPKVPVPDLGGLTRSQLEARLRGRGLELGEVERVFSLEPKGTVVAQDPSEGRILWGDPIDVTLSKGPRSLEVPEIVGMKSAAAQRALRRAGFEPVPVDSYSDDVEPGVVISTEPGSGAMAAEASEVTVYVSIGPKFEELTMPDVRNLPLEQARAKLEGKGLRVKVVECGLSGTTVVDSDPIAGVTVRENDVVALFVC